MYISTVLSVLAALAIPVAGISGQATTTRYGGGTGGSCGCGMDGNWQWQLGMSAGVYTAAGSQALFDTGNAGTSWCGGGCGTCYQLTSTGTSATGGGGPAAGQSIIVMLTNFCPPEGNAQWCPASGSTNAYGFGYHFDIMAEDIIFGDNMIVNFTPVACPSSASSMWSSCQCSGSVTPPTVASSPPPSAPAAASSSASSTSTAIQAAPSTINHQQSNNSADGTSAECSS